MKNTWLRFKLLYIILFSLLFLQFILPHWNAALNTYHKFIYPQLLKFANITWAKSFIPWGDILYILFIFLSLYYLFLFFIAYKKKKLKAWIIKLLTTSSLIYLFFLFFWGINYHIPKMENSKENKNKLSTVHIINLHHFFIDQIDEKQLYNAINLDFSSVLNDAINIQKSHSDLVNNWNLKPSLFSFWIERSGTSGYYNPFTFESYVNKNLPKSILPFVCLHELAHQAGVAKEGEANYFAYSIAKKSKNIYFKNAAYFQGFIYTSSYLKRNTPELYERIFNNLPKEISDAYQEYLDYVNKHSNSPLKFTSKIFDTFLKTQGQKEGIKSYSLFLDWIYLEEKEIHEGFPPYQQ